MKIQDGKVTVEVDKKWYSTEERQMAKAVCIIC